MNILKGAASVVVGVVGLTVFAVAGTAAAAVGLTVELFGAKKYDANGCEINAAQSS